MKFSQSQHWACFSELRRELQGGCGDSAGLSVCVREQNILRWVGGGGWAVNLSSTCSLDSGAWCEVSSGRYPIDHIYYIHHSASLFWQLIAPGKEKGRIGFLFKRRGFFEHEHCLCIFFFSLCSGSSDRDQSLMLAPSPRQKPQLLRNDILSAVLESFFERNNFDEKKQKKKY